MSVKIPVSSKPFNDHAVTAAFHFQRASDFFDGIRLMVRENHRIRNEFYVDAMPIFLSKMGKRTAFFDVDYYFSWGTPADLYEYQMMEYCVRSKVPRIEISNASAGNIKKWKKYFAKKN